MTETEIAEEIVSDIERSLRSRGLDLREYVNDEDIEQEIHDEWMQMVRSRLGTRLGVLGDAS